MDFSGADCVSSIPRNSSFSQIDNISNISMQISESRRLYSFNPLIMLFIMLHIWHGNKKNKFIIIALFTERTFQIYKLQITCHILFSSASMQISKSNLFFRPSIKKWYKLWQYGLWSFQAGASKLEIFLYKNQHTQKKWLNFEFWINGELSKGGHLFSNKVI